MSRRNIIILISVGVVIVALVVVGIIFRNQLLTLAGLGGVNDEQAWEEHQVFKEEFNQNYMGIRNVCEGYAGGTYQAGCVCSNFTLGSKYPITTPAQAAKDSLASCKAAIKRYEDFQATSEGIHAGEEIEGGLLLKEVANSCNPTCSSAVPTQCRLSSAESVSGKYTHTDGVIPMSQYQCAQGQVPTYFPGYLELGDIHSCGCTASCTDATGQAIAKDLFDYQQCASDEEVNVQNGQCVCLKEGEEPTSTEPEPTVTPTEAATLPPLEQINGEPPSTEPVAMIEDGIPEPGVRTINGIEIEPTGPIAPLEPQDLPETPTEPTPGIETIVSPTPAPIPVIVPTAEVVIPTIITPTPTLTITPTPTPAAIAQVVQTPTPISTPVRISPTPTAEEVAETGATDSLILIILALSFVTIGSILYFSRRKST